MSRVRVAIVDDASFIRASLTRLFENEPRVEIVGVAATGEILLEHLDDWRPDAITLDLNMPGMGGLATLDEIMARRPARVIILSTHSGEGAPLTIEALSRGAVDFVDKEAYSLVDFQALRSVLIERILGESNGARPQPNPAVPSASPPPQPPHPALSLSPPPTRAVRDCPIDAVLIGASTGGPKAIETVLADLGGAPAVPILLVQHMPRGFTGAFAERLDRCLPFPVREARHGERLVRGEALLAPAGWHMTVGRDGDEYAVSLVDDYDETPHVPSVDVLFQSAADTFEGRCAAVLLTGMGSDGAVGMAALAGHGAHTIAQDHSSCVVYGMPRAAITLNAASAVLHLRRIGPQLRRIVSAPVSRHAVAS